MLVHHGLDAGLRGQQREVVLLLSPEDQADPWRRLGVRAGRQEPPAHAHPGPALTVGDAWALSDPAGVEGVAAAVGGVVESPEVPGSGRAQTGSRLCPAPARAAGGAAACLMRPELFATGQTPGVAPPCPHSPGLAVLAIVAAREDEAAAVAAAGVCGARGQQSQDVHIVVAVPLAHGRLSRRVGPVEAVAAGAVALWRGVSSARPLARPAHCPARCPAG